MFGLIPFTNHNTNELGENFRDFLSDFFSDDFFAPMSFTNDIDKLSSDIKETDNEYLVCASLPGVNKEDIDLDYIDNNLILKVRKQENYENSKDNFFKKANYYNEFSRSYYLENVDRSKIRAKFENDKLKIILPKQVPTKSSHSSIFIE